MLNLTVVGNLGRDAELAYTQNQTAVANLSIACQYGMKDQSTGKKPTQWVEAALWGKQAEALTKYLTKGTKIVAILRDAHIETYNKRDGGQGFKLVGSVTEISFASSQQDSGQPQKPAPQAATAAQGNVAGQYSQQAQQQQQQQQQGQTWQQQAQQAQMPPADFGDFSDEIPF